MGAFLSSKVVKIFGSILLAIYVYSMFVSPFLDSNSNWSYVKGVWERWQTLNAGALAFLASLIAFRIASLSEHRQREREFIAARTFLPEAFSSLMEYLRLSANIYVSLWNAHGRANAGFARPVLTNEYREVFRDCIRHANPTVGAYLANILVLLQVHDARMRQVLEQVGPGQEQAVTRHNVLTYLYRTGELYALLGKQFEFARGQDHFNESPLSWEEFRNAYGILRIHFEQIYIDPTSNLEAFTRRRIERTSRDPEAEQ